MYLRWDGFGKMTERQEQHSEYLKRHVKTGTLLGGFNDKLFIVVNVYGNDFIIFNIEENFWHTIKANDLVFNFKEILG
jgi:hypothetical protein